MRDVEYPRDVGTDARSEGSANGRVLSLLWVEDSRSMRTIIKLRAAELALRVELAASASHARRVLERGEQFDWVVCDYQLNGGTSAEFVREMMDEGRRVAVLTGAPDRVDRSLGVRIFSKPIELAILVDELRTLI